MAKKNFDDFLDTVEKPRRPSPEEAARMVAEIHATTASPAPVPAADTQVKADITNSEATAAAQAKPLAKRAVKPAAAKTKSPAPPLTNAAEAARRGRPRTERNETERLYRLSVDLPGSLLLKLKGAAMEEGSDMKTYVRHLINDHLNGVI